MAAALNEDVEKFDELGYVVFRNVIDEALLVEVREHVGWLRKRLPDVPPELLVNFLAADDPFWVRFVGDDRLLDIAQRFIGPNIALFAGHYFCKDPFTGKPVLWHQDGDYYPLEPMELATLWVAVDDSTTDNGCLQVIPGSHLGGLKGLVRRKDVDNVLGTSTDPSFVDESSAVDIVLRAGDVEVHHPSIMHASEANTSANRRCGCAVRYIPTTTWVNSTEPLFSTNFLLRGDAAPGVANTYLPRPKWIASEHIAFRGCESWT